MKTSEKRLYGARRVSATAVSSAEFPKKTANEIFDEMTSFASYAFNKSHAAAYATIAYQTAYLKYHFYKEYMAALMTVTLLESTEKLNSYVSDCIKKRGKDTSCRYKQKLKRLYCGAGRNTLCLDSGKKSG